MQTTHLFTNPLVKFGDVSLQQQQLPLRFDEHLSDMHRGSGIIHPCEYDELFQQGGGNRYVCDCVGVGVQQHHSAELVRERVRQEIIKRIIILGVPGQRVHVGSRVGSGAV